MSCSRAHDAPRHALTRAVRARLAPLALALALAAGGLPGCCSHRCYGPDDLPQSKELRTPYDTVDFLRFCVRHELWEPIFTALSRETCRQLGQEEGEELSFAASIAVAVIFPDLTLGEAYAGAGTVPDEFGDLSITELIHGSAILYIGAPLEPLRGIPPERQAQVSLFYDPVDPMLTMVLLVNEGSEESPRWKLGLAETGWWLHALGAL